MISTNNYICFVIIKTQKPGDCNLSKQYLSMISHCDSAFAVWNILTSLELQTTINVEKESSGEESEQAFFMVQGNDSLEVNLMLN